MSHVFARLLFSVHQAQETKTPLAAAASAIVAFADAWGPSGFPVPLDEHEQDGDSSQAANSVNQAMPPKPILLHRAVWAQAEVLAARCQLLLRAGENLSAEIRRKADLVRKTVRNRAIHHSVLLRPTPI